MGGSLGELHKATCIEKLEGEDGVQQAQRNAELVAASDGHLAPLNGKEAFCSVGCGHTVAVCRAVAAGCRVSMEDLDRDGDAPPLVTLVPFHVQASPLSWLRGSL